MRRAVVVLLVTTVLMVLVFNLSSCEKERSSPPAISFTTTSPYVYSDTVLYRQSIFNVKVNASKVSLNDLLTSGKITRSINGGPDSTLLDMSFFSQNFAQFYSFTAGDSGNVEKYTFSFGTQQGQSASASLTISVN